MTNGRGVGVYSHCLHCTKYKRTERRGLCRPCSDTPGVRQLYPTRLTPPLKCRHCKRNKRQKGKRGLCFMCYEDRAVRALYPIACKPPDDGVRPGHRPAKATSHPPGTWAKLKVLCERFDAGDALHHPDDAKRLDYETADDLLPRAREKAAG